MTNFRLFQTERVGRRQFQILRKWRKSSKQVENTVGKGEIARYEQFLLFPQCFQKACFQGASKGVVVWKWIKLKKPFPKKALVFICPLYKSFENTMGKGEIACKEQFLLFSQCVLPGFENFLPFASNLKS